MKRKLIALRIEITPPPGKGGIWEFIAGLGEPGAGCCRTASGKKWCDVVVGDKLIDDAGHERTVLKVSIFRAYGGEDGTEITSGRAWLHGEQPQVR